MQSGSHSICLILAALSVCERVFADTPTRYVNSREIELSFDANDAVVERVTVWTRDEHGAWVTIEPERVSTGGIRVRAAADGVHAYYLVLENRDGQSAEAPNTGDEPHILVTVDTAAPTIQVHGLDRADGNESEAGFVLRLSLIEENLTEEGLRLFWREESQPVWIDGGALRIPAGRQPGAVQHIPLLLPAGMPSGAELMLVATDRAGNQSRERVPSPIRSSPALVSEHAFRKERGTLDPGVIFGPPLMLADIPTPEPAISETGEKLSMSERARLRSLASRFSAEGRLDLAVARLQDVLAAAPRDAETLNELGRVQLRAQRPAEAKKSFESCLALLPDDPTALEGLALVAVQRRELPDARNLLKRLLDLKSEDGRVWLRYGDVEFSLGNRAEAFQAWNQASTRGLEDADLRAKARARLTSLNSSR